MDDDLLKIIELIKECNINELKKYKHVNINRSDNGRCWFDEISSNTDTTNKLKLIKYILSNFMVDINLENRYGETLLFHLYEDSDIEIIEYLSNVLDFNKKDINNKKLYDYAVEYKSEKLIAYLRRKTRIDNRQLLFEAILQGNVDDINNCISFGENVIGFFKYSDLSKNEITNLKSTLDNFDKVGYSSITDFSDFLISIGEMSLPTSLEIERFKVFIQLIGDRINNKCYMLKKMFNIEFLMFGEINLLYPRNSRCLIHNICETGSIDLLNIFLLNKPNCLARTSENTTSLHICTKRNDDKMLRVLIDNINVKVNNIKTKTTVKTALHYAVTANNINIVDMLIEYGEDLNAKDINGECVVMYALTQRKTEIFSHLVKNHNIENFRNQMKSLLYDEPPLKKTNFI